MIERWIYPPVLIFVDLCRRQMEAYRKIQDEILVRWEIEPLFPVYIANNW